MENPGLLVALEGGGDEFRATQIKLLSARLEAIGHQTYKIKFPRLEHQAGYFTKQYLDGRYHAAGQSPTVAYLFSALDRFDAAGEIRNHLANGYIVLAENYSGSSMANQAALYGKAAEQRGFFVWAENFDYEVLDIPRPAVSFWLAGGDFHNAATDSFQLLSDLFAKDFSKVGENDALRANERIWQTLKSFLPPPGRSPKALTVKLAITKKVKNDGNKAREAARNSKSRPKPVVQQPERIMAELLKPAGALVKFKTRQAKPHHSGPPRLHKIEPRNEFDLLGDVSARWPYARKQKALLKLLGDRQTAVNYKFLVTCSYYTLSRLPARAIEVRSSSQGYLLPAIIEGTQLEEKYTAAVEAAKKKLLAHNAVAIIKFQPAELAVLGPAFGLEPEIWQAITDAIREKHPIIASHYLETNR